LSVKVNGGRVIAGTFEDLDLVNKYAGIAMNPPFGQGGSTAVAHLAKAAWSHLAEGGRIVALIPEGPAADKAFAKFITNDKSENLILRSTIRLPESVFERAGTSVRTRIVIIDRAYDGEPQVAEGGHDANLSSDGDIKTFFESIRDMDAPDRLPPPVVAQAVANLLSGRSGMLPSLAATVPTEQQPSAVRGTPGGLVEPLETKHTQTGAPLYVARLTRRVSDANYTAINQTAKSLGGYYSRFAKGGAIPGFQFTTRESRDAFARQLNEPPAPPPSDTAFSLKLAQREDDYGVPVSTRRTLRAAVGSQLVVQAILDGADTFETGNRQTQALRDLGMSPKEFWAAVRFGDPSLEARLSDMPVQTQPAARPLTQAEMDWAPQPPPEAADVAYSLKPQAYRNTPNGGDPQIERIGYLTGKHSPTIQQRAVARGDIGLLVQPDSGHSLDAARSYPFFAVDNGVFGKKGFRAEAFEKLINGLTAADADKLLFVVAPDVIGDAAGTLEQFKEWGPKIRERGLPVALAAQDGLEDIPHEIPWDNFDAMFIGGSTAWKIGQFADPVTRLRWEMMINEAHHRGIPIHVGRVNSNLRLTGHAIDMGASTVDGTMLAHAPDQNLGHLESWLDQINQNGLKYAARHFTELGRLPTLQELTELAAQADSVGSLGAYEPALDEINRTRVSLGLRELQRPAPETPGQSTFAFSLKAPRMIRSFKMLEDATMQWSNFRDWYAHEKTALDTMFGTDSRLFMKFLAATSANSSVIPNAQFALKAYSQYIHGEPFHGFMGVVIANLNRAVAGEELSGPKIHPFDRALAGDATAIAVDRHIIRAIFGEDAAANETNIAKAQNVIRQIAEKHGWTPREAQAALWAWNIDRRGETPRRYTDAINPSTVASARAGSGLGRAGVSVGQGDVGGVRPSEDAGRGVLGDSGIAYSLKTPAEHPALAPSIEKFRKEYPSAPEIVVSEETGKRGAYFDPKTKRIVVVPTAMPENAGGRRQQLFAALQDAGVRFIADNFWAGAWNELAKTSPETLQRTAAYLKVDPTTQEGRRAVLAEMVRQRQAQPAVFGLVGRLLRSLRAQSDFTPRPVVERMQRALENATEAFTATTQLPQEPNEPAGPNQDAQVYADQHAAIWYGIRPGVARLEELARELSQKYLDDALWGQNRARLTAIAKEVEAASLGAGNRTPQRLADPNLLYTARKFGIPINAADERAHEAHLTEMQVRSTLSLILALAENKRVHTFLTENMPEFPVKKLAAQIGRQSVKLAGIEEASPEIADMARGLKARMEAIPLARAATDALADPRLQDWVEIIHQIEESGVTPRTFSEMPPNLRSAAMTAASMFRYHTDALVTSVTDSLAAVTDKNLAALRKLANQRLEVRAKHGNIEMGIVDLIAAAVGDPGASGGLYTVEVARQIRALDQQLMHFAVALGRSVPGTTVAAIRDAFADGSNLGDEWHNIFSAVGVHEAAVASAISDETVKEILELAKNQPEFRNMVVGLADEADSRSDANLLNAIERLQATRDSVFNRQTTFHGDASNPKASANAMRAVVREANQQALMAAGPMIERLRTQQSGLETTNNSLDSEIETVERELRAAQYLHDLADDASQAAQSFAPGELGTVEMVFRTSNGEYFAGFTKADGSKQLGIRLGPYNEYNEATVRKVLDWRVQAMLAAEAETNSPAITRGLIVGAGEALTAIDIGSASQGIRQSIAPTKAFEMWTRMPTGIRSAISHLVPGIMGRRLAHEMARYASVGGRVNAILGKFHNRRMVLMRSAYDSMELSPVNPLDQTTFASGYSETAHRLRRFGNTVAAGESLFYNTVRGLHRVTPELLTLIRFDRDVFREVQKLVGSEPYGGIRETLPGGIRLIRPPAETGEVGLARMVDHALEMDLASNLSVAETAAADAGRKFKASDLAGMWAMRRETVLAHILDSDRTDLAFDRDQTMLRLERQYAADLRASRVPMPNSVQQMIDALVGLAGDTVNNATETVPTRLYEELAAYARVARSRVSGLGQSEQPKTSSGVFNGEDDTNEFTSPAAKLIYPSNFYHYGAENDIRAAVERMADRAQVGMLDAMSNAAQALRGTARRAGLGPFHLNAEDLSVIRWSTPNYYDNYIDTITEPQLAEAVITLNNRAALLENEMQKLRTYQPMPSFATQLVRTAYPMILGTPHALLTNIVGGPVSIAHTLAPIYGRFPAAVMTVGAALFSGANMVAEMVYGTAKALGIDISGKHRNDALNWLESIGNGLSYSHAEIQSMQLYAVGPGIGKKIIRVATRIGDWNERNIGQHIGVSAGDRTLNRMAAQFVVPVALWRMKELALRWQARILTQKAVPGATANAEHIFNRDDSPVHARLRQQLQDADLNPEDFLSRLASGEIDVRRYWEHPDGSKFGQAIIADFNSATRTNRPHPNTWLGLLGWVSATTSEALELFGTQPNVGKPRRFLSAAIAAMSVALAWGVAKYTQAYASRALNETQTVLARMLADALRAPPPPDDDEVGWFNRLRNLLARVVAAFEVNTSPTLLPHELGWWKRPLPAIGMELALAPLQGIGLQNMVEGGSLRTPILGMGLQAFEAAMLLGKAGYKAATGNTVEAWTNVKMAIREAAGSAGLIGRVLSNFVSPPERKVVHDIRMAANEVGIQFEAAKAMTSFAFMGNTPTRGPMLEAARDLVRARTPDEKAAALARVTAVGMSVYQSAYDRVIERGGYANPNEAKQAADTAGRRAVQGALSAIEPVTRSLGRSITPTEFEQLKGTGVLDTPEVKEDTAAVLAAARALHTVRGASTSPLVNVTPALTSPIAGSFLHTAGATGGSMAGAAGGSSKVPSLAASIGGKVPGLGAGGGGAGGGFRPPTLGRLRRRSLRAPRPRRTGIVRLGGAKKIALRRPRKITV